MGGNLYYTFDVCIMCKAEGFIGTQGSHSFVSLFYLPFFFFNPSVLYYYPVGPFEGSRASDRSHRVLNAIDCAYMQTARTHNTNAALDHNP